MQRKEMKKKDYLVPELQIQELYAKDVMLSTSGTAPGQAGDDDVPPTSRQGAWDDDEE